MKGASSLIASVMLVLISVVISVFISGWLTTTTTTQTTAIRNTTNTQLQCQFADIYIKNITYNCNSNCAAGTAHTTTLALVNSGKRLVYVDRIYFTNTTGNVFTLSLNETKSLNIGDTLTLTNVSSDTCSGINRSVEFVTVNTLNCPGAAYDNIDGTDILFVNC